MGKKVKIDTEECIVTESCVELCPDVFGFDEEADKAFVLMPEGDSEECIHGAIETCPDECFYWE
jgi:ferredoxin